MSMRKQYVSIPYLFKIYSETIFRELKVLLGFIIDGHNLHNLRYSDDTVSIAGTKCKLPELQSKLWHKVRSMDRILQVDKLSARETFGIEIGDTKFLQVQDINNQGSVLTEIQMQKDAHFIVYENKVNYKVVIEPLSNHDLFQKPIRIF